MHGDATLKQREYAQNSKDVCLIFCTFPVGGDGVDYGAFRRVLCDGEQKVVVVSKKRRVMKIHTICRKQLVDGVWQKVYLERCHRGHGGFYTFDC